MWSKVIVLALLYILEVRTQNTSPYCALSCGTSHTMCRYKSGPGASCVGYSKQPLSASDKKDILGYHNSLRQRVASGLETPQPGAADMLQMEWDEELSTIAQRWVDQCIWGHDSCRISAKFSVGQNMATWATSGKTVDLKAVIKSMVNGWYSEVKYCPVREVRNFTNSGTGGNAIGHYTQLVWAKSNKLGCGVVVQKSNNIRVTLGCNYGPTGNIKYRPMYTTGKACTACPANTKCSTEYKGLCAASLSRASVWI